MEARGSDKRFGVSVWALVAAALLASSSYGQMQDNPTTESGRVFKNAAGQTTLDWENLLLTGGVWRVSGTATSGWEVVNWQTMTNHIASGINYHVEPLGSNLWDFGTLSNPWRTGVFHTVIVSTNSLILGTYVLSVDSDGNLTLDGSSVAGGQALGTMDAGTHTTSAETNTVTFSTTLIQVPESVDVTPLGWNEMVAPTVVDGSITASNFQYVVQTPAGLATNGGKVSWSASVGGTSVHFEQLNNVYLNTALTNTVAYWTGSGVTNNVLWGWEPVSRTINFTNTMSSAEIQAEIEAAGRYIPKGVILTFQFADGSYTITNELELNGFYGGGSVYIQGNITEANASDLHTTQQVFLDGSSGASSAVVDIDNCKAQVLVRNLKIAIKTSDTWRYGIYGRRSSFINVNYNYVYGNGNVYGGCIIFGNGTQGRVRENYVSNANSGVWADIVARLESQDNDDTGTQPRWGLTASAGVIYKDGTQPTGSSGNENTADGGEIR
jgi:hypothetical protein